jgi:protein SCO1
MPSPVSKNPRRRARLALVSAVVAAALGTSGAAAGSNPFADRFPDVVLRSHEGKNVRFYEDLLQGKIVLINFMYASCKGR